MFSEPTEAMAINDSIVGINSQGRTSDLQIKSPLFLINYPSSDLANLVSV